MEPDSFARDRSPVDPANLSAGRADGSGEPDLLRILLTLAPDVAARIRHDVPRRRPRRSQSGPTVDLGDGDTTT